MKKTLMVSVAVAALWAATGLAMAQVFNRAERRLISGCSPKGDAASDEYASTKGAETATPGAAPKAAVPQHAQASRMEKRPAT